jgi:hypothetical protein
MRYLVELIRANFLENVGRHLSLGVLVPVVGTLWTCSYGGVSFQVDRSSPPGHHMNVHNDGVAKTGVRIVWQCSQPVTVQSQGCREILVEPPTSWTVVGQGVGPPERRLWQFGDASSSSLNPKAEFVAAFGHARDIDGDEPEVWVSSRELVTSMTSVRENRWITIGLATCLLIAVAIIGKGAYKLWRSARVWQNMCARCLSDSPSERDAEIDKFRKAWDEDTLRFIRTLWPRANEDEQQDRLMAIYSEIWHTSSKGSFETIRSLRNKSIIRFRIGSGEISNPGNAS